MNSYYREDGEEYDIRVRYDRKFRESLADIENITIYNPQGMGVKVRDLGVVREAYTRPPSSVRTASVTLPCRVSWATAMR